MLYVHFPAAAQDTPRAELFLGYSALVTPSETTVVTDVADNIRLKRERSFINGWNASLSVNVNSWLGFAGDFSGHYGPIDYNARTSVNSLTFGSSARIHHFLVGPRFAAERGSSKVFLHGLIGAVSYREFGTVSGISLDETDTGLAYGVGGGVDHRINERLSWRIFQTDYLRYRFGQPKLVVNNVTVSDAVTQNNFRISTGLVFRN